LVTNNNNKNGGVFAYEIPSDPKASSSVFPKHLLHDGFKPLHPLNPGAGAPGNTALAKSTDGSKPSIVVSGDDSGLLVVLEPNSKTSSDWTYTATTLYAASGTTGNVHVEDIDGDGLVDLLVAQYTESTVQFWLQY
jgi:hypothetical protein